MKKEYSFIIMLLAISLLSTFALADVDSSKIVSISLVNQDPDPAIAGDIVEIRLGIENKGGAAIEDIVIEVDPEYPFELVSGEDSIEEIGTLKPYQSGSDIKIIKYMLRVDRDAIAGQYELRILQYGPEGKDVWYGAKTVNLDIKSKESAEVIYIDQVELLPGEITPMTFTINNVGSSPLRDLTFHWENEEGVILPVGSDDTKYIKYIEIGESAELVYNVIASANAEPDLYKLQLSLKYDDSITGEENEIATSAGVYIGGKTDFDVTFSGASKGETSFSIANIGSVPANSITISIPKQEGWKVSGIDSVIIGNLNKGDYTIASFNIEQTTGWTGTPAQKISEDDTQESLEEPRKSRDSIQPQPTLPGDGAMGVNIEISYTDTRGGRHIVTKKVNIASSPMTMGEDGQISFDGKTRPTSESSLIDNLFTNAKWVGLGIIISIIWVILRNRHKSKNLKDSKLSHTKMIKDMFKKKK